MEVIRIVDLVVSVVGTGVEGGVESNSNSSTAPVIAVALVFAIIMLVEKSSWQSFGRYRGRTRFSRSIGDTLFLSPTSSNHSRWIKSYRHKAIFRNVYSCLLDAVIKIQNHKVYVYTGKAIVLSVLSQFFSKLWSGENRYIGLLKIYGEGPQERPETIH